MMLEQPIFIVGVGRSGSTIFHRIFSEHPNVAWLSSRLCNKFPNRPSVNRRLMQAIDYPLAGRFLRKRFRTGEGYDLWEYYCKGFSEPCRDLLAEDVTNRVKETIPNVMSEIITPKRNRLLIKITGWPRIGFLHEIFPDARFIHVSRDRSAVINSMINIDWWSGWRGPQNWRWGELTPAQKEEWERFNRSFIALAGIQIQILAEAMEKAKRSIDANQFMEVRYKNLCTKPVALFKNVIEFCELEWSVEFEDLINKHPLKSTDYKWRKELTIEQQKIVEYFANDPKA